MLKRYLIIGDHNTGHYTSMGGSQNPKLMIRQGMIKEDVKDALSVQTGWQPGPDEKIFFFPGCDVPRYKIREKFQVTIKPENATSAFISIQNLTGNDKLFDVEDYVPIPGKLLEGYYESNKNPMNEFFVTKFKSLLLNCEDTVLVPSRVYYYIYYKPFYNSTKHESFNDYLNANDIENDLCNPRWADGTKLYVPTTNSKLSAISCPIYFQDEALKYINEGSLIVDKTKYEELVLMCNSSDDENTVLVMELISNADYQKSLLYLCLLIAKFGPNMASKKEASTVNFQGLLRFLGLTVKELRGSISIETITRSLKKHNQFTRQNAQRLAMVMADNWYSGQSDTEHYTTGPVPKDDVDFDDIISDSDQIEIPDEEDNMNL